MNHGERNIMEESMSSITISSIEYDDLIKFKQKATELQEQNSRLNETIDKMSKTIERLTNKLKDMDEHIKRADEAEKLAKKLQEDLKTERERTTGLENDKQDLNSKLTAVKNQLNDKTNDLEKSNASYKTVQQQSIRLLSEKEGLKEQILQISQRTKSELERVSVQFKHESEEIIKQLQKELTAVKEKSANDLAQVNASYANAQAEIEKLKARAQEDARLRQAAEDGKNAAQSELANALDRERVLKKDLERAQQSEQALNIELNVKTQVLQDLEKGIAETKQKDEEFKRDIHGRLERAKEEQAAQIARVTAEWQKKVQDLKDERERESSASGSQTAVAALQKTVDERDAQIGRLQAQHNAYIEQLIRTHVTEIQNFVDEQDRYAQQVKDLDAKVRKLTEDLKAAGGSVGGGGSVNADARAPPDVNALRQNWETERQQLIVQAARKQKEMQDKHIQEVVALRKEYDDTIKKVQAEANDAKKQVIEVRTVHESVLRRESGNYQQTLKDANARIQALESANEITKKDYEDARAQFQETIAVLDRDREQLRHEIEGMRLILRQTEDEHRVAIQRVREDANSELDQFRESTMQPSGLYMYLLQCMREKANNYHQGAQVESQLVDFITKFINIVKQQHKGAQF